MSDIPHILAVVNANSMSDDVICHNALADVIPLRPVCIMADVVAQCG